MNGYYFERQNALCLMAGLCVLVRDVSGASSYMLELLSLVAFASRGDEECECGECPTTSNGHKLVLN